MALLAESLVEEWLNRKGFFTIRGLKHGVGEMDILAIKPEDGSVIGWHVEVQVSVRPIGYISKLTKEQARLTGIVRTSAKTRNDETIEVAAREWVKAKFSAKTKLQLRERLWPNVEWSFHLVHGVVKEQKELDIFKSMNVQISPFHEVIREVIKKRENGGFSGSAGGDLAEIIGYYHSS